METGIMGYISLEEPMTNRAATTLVVLLVVRIVEAAAVMAVVAVVLATEDQKTSNTSIRAISWQKQRHQWQEQQWLTGKSSSSIGAAAGRGGG